MAFLQPVLAVMYLVQYMPTMGYFLMDKVLPMHSLIQELSHSVLEMKVWSLLCAFEMLSSPGYRFTSQKDNILVCPCVFGHCNSLCVLNSFGGFR